MIIRMMSQQLTLLSDEARKAYPVEACALLFGKLTEEEAVVERAVVMSNVLRSPVRFEIDPKAFYEAFTSAREAGLEFIGFFHSHPAPAHPSSIDLQFMRLWGDVVWLILSSDDNRIAAFQMQNGKVHALTLKTDGKT